MMSKKTEQIRTNWMVQWRKEALADDAAWLRDMLENPDATTSELIDAQLTLLSLIPVEEPEGDWDPNYLLSWQRYDAELDEDLVTIQLHGKKHALLFAEPDTLEELPFDQIFEALQTERVAIESGDDDIETLFDAANYIEATLDLPAPDFDAGAQTTLPWTGDSGRLEVDLTSPEAQQVLDF
ncbi:hypothetical protein [Bradymonas sediminis]|uniref:Uncharacterized protein n=1 Tax=Bradymonas sediminis TaxID=1548548 RepID=A0A2Z4FM48_9DELT|nr:hypothetical protein [Bradymonas sediminis]AWV89748.1 hypothetical protein DN745_10525 [Bradymonas sediminis]TDP76505.1 hypothetical protein DFR33_102136 [Bradymonas sediminis]